MRECAYFWRFFEKKMHIFGGYFEDGCIFSEVWQETDKFKFFIFKKME